MERGQFTVNHGEARRCVWYASPDMSRMYSVAVETLAAACRQHQEYRRGRIGEAGRGVGVGVGCFR